jgi:hypothetical protein
MRDKGRLLSKLTLFLFYDKLKALKRYATITLFMKHYFIFAIFVLGLLIGLPASASMWPNDAKTSYNEITGNATNQVLLTKPNNNFSILYLASLTNTNEVNARIRLYCGSNTILDISKAQSNENIERFTTQNCSNNLLITTNNLNSTDRTSIHIIYTDYNLASSTSDIASSTPPTSTAYGSSTSMTFFNNIAQIGYTATTTLTGSGQTITTGYYYIPFILFKFILIVICLTIMTVLILLFFNKKTKWL